MTLFAIGLGWGSSSSVLESAEILPMRGKRIEYWKLTKAFGTGHIAESALPIHWD